MKKNKVDKNKVKNYYWLVAGVLVGVYTVLMAYINLTIIASGLDSDLSFSSTGVAVVVAQYAVIIYLLGRIHNRF
jgi:hypothetical protein